MSTQDIHDGLAEIFYELAGIESSDFLPEKSIIDDFDVDSLLMVELIVAIEEKFEIKLPDDAVKEVATVGSLVRFIDSCRVPV